MNPSNAFLLIVWLSASSAAPFFSRTRSRGRAFVVESVSTHSLQNTVSILRGGAEAEGTESSLAIDDDDIEKITKEEKEEALAQPKETIKRKKPKTSKQAKEHLARPIQSTNPNYRIQRELKEFIKDPPPGLSVQVGKNLRVWIVTVEGPGIYQGETFRLRISFPPQYPVVPPSVYFLPPHLPVGPHFYTNGDICLSLLGKDWRPTMTAQSIAISILSMLASTPKKVMPMDNAAHAHNKPGQYQKDWVYHDDNC
ncbi:ubiquitin-conjugating enzyme E2 W [Fistulifera solaris]|uniref:Ubiquitin-conjugating enzyme E2 W n=1 Tax=Fistulifera solaris TaxID=1519565 RepID=A0A1Z5K6B8_FISSO|nr:ubiquitin-conjugating enzyme E2 W [Fistulifera solaris]|eukprot:GAX21784.1 ubiquitin-conjugating enzyme E2 W [Fistulifera solaris]